MQTAFNKSLFFYFDLDLPVQILSIEPIVWNSWQISFDCEISVREYGFLPKVRSLLKTDKLQSNLTGG
jgi:hypothetical protein